ncbi:MAG: hypothetical protein AB7L09_02690 [Nitrospira sp.]
MQSNDADGRNYPQERRALNGIDESLLSVWAKREDMLGRAGREIVHSRFWLERMERDIWNGNSLVTRSMQRLQLMLGLIQEIRGALVECQGERNLDPDHWIGKIDAVMNSPLLLNEG